MLLPNAQGAIIDEAKLRDYLLSEVHPVGRFKARFVMCVVILAGNKIPRRAIVHHIDGNQLNNAPANLILFSSQHAHLQHHRNCTPDPDAFLFDGRLDSPQHRAAAIRKVQIINEIYTTGQYIFKSRRKSA